MTNPERDKLTVRNFTLPSGRKMRLTLMLSHYRVVLEIEDLEGWQPVLDMELPEWTRKDYR